MVEVLWRDVGGGRPMARPPLAAVLGLVLAACVAAQPTPTPAPTRAAAGRVRGGRRRFRLRAPLRQSGGVRRAEHAQLPRAAVPRPGWGSAPGARHPPRPRLLRGRAGDRSRTTAGAGGPVGAGGPPGIRRDPPALQGRVPHRRAHAGAARRSLGGRRDRAGPLSEGPVGRWMSGTGPAVATHHCSTKRPRIARRSVRDTMLARPACWSTIPTPAAAPLLERHRVATGGHPAPAVGAAR
jgi:hypothetical protein